ncbi:uncharacterized protein RhaS with RHS repeats [Rhizobium sp. BK619]|nr:uncharacterized protein RhaS with RHS repeats [Rhizobium sp. BK619]
MTTHFYRETRLWASMTAALVIASAAQADTATTKYSYDADGRLTTALYDNGLCIQYSYDANGNRTAVQTSTPTTPPRWGSGSWGCFDWPDQ